MSHCWWVRPCCCGRFPVRAKRRSSYTERAGCFSRISLYADITRRVSCLRRRLMWFKSLYSYWLMDLGRRFR